MNDSCIPIDELGRVRELPEQHPARAHLERCTRCQSLVAMLREFESPTSQRDDAGFERVDAQLRSTISGLVAGPANGSPDVEATAPQRTERAAPRPRRFLGLPAAPRLAWAFAALLVVGVAGTVLWRAREAGETLRSASPGGGAAEAFAAGESREVLGGVELVWRAYPGATHYRVLFLDGSLRERARGPVVDARSWVLRAAELPAPLAHGALAGWQVEALSGADRLAITPVRSLRVP